MTLQTQPHASWFPHFLVCIPILNFVSRSVVVLRFLCLISPVEVVLTSCCLARRSSPFKPAKLISVGSTSATPERLLVSAALALLEILHRFLIAYLLEHVVLEFLLLDLQNGDDVLLDLGDLILVLAVCEPYANLVELGLEVQDEASDHLRLGSYLLSYQCKEEVLPILAGV